MQIAKLRIFISFCGADIELRDMVKNKFQSLRSFFKKRNCSLAIADMYSRTFTCYDEWSIWTENNIKDSDVLVPIITENVKKIFRNKFGIEERLDKIIMHEIEYCFSHGIKVCPLIATDISKLEGYEILLEGTSQARIENFVNPEQGLKIALNELYYKVKIALRKVLDGDASQPDILPKTNIYEGADFFGRVEEMERIDKIFGKSNVVILFGQGGMGKTSLAQNYFLKNKDFYSKGIIIPISNGIKEGLGSYKLENTYYYSNELNERYKTNLTKLGKLSDRTLIILDNGESAVSIEDVRDLRGLSCRFIITTRVDIFLNRISVFIDSLNYKYLIEIVYSKYPLIEKKHNMSSSEMKCALNHFFDVVGGHTLTIEMSASIMKNTGYTIQYVCEKLLDITDEADPTEHTPSKQTIFNRLSTLFDLAKLCEEEKKIIYTLTLITPDTGINRTILKEVLKLENFNYIMSLSEKSFLYYNDLDAMVRLHPLFSDVIYKKTKKYIIYDNFKNILDCLLTMKIDEDNLESIQNKINYLLFLISHRVEIFNTEDGQYKLVDIYYELSNLYDILARYEEAYFYATKALNLCEITNKNLNLYRTAKIYDLLGTICDERNLPQESINNFKKALKIKSSISNDWTTDIELSKTCIGLGNAYDNFGKYYRAIYFYFLSRDIRLKYFKNDEIHIEVSDCYHNLGAVYDELGECIDEAKYNYEKALDIRERIYNDNLPHIKLAESYNCLGIFYKVLENYEKAEDYYLKALAIYEKIYIKYSSPNMANLYANMGNLYRILGESDPSKLDLSLEYQNKALNMRLEIYQQNPNHFYIADSYSNLSILYDSMKKYPSALRYQLLALEIRKKNKGRPLDISNSYVNLGKIYDSMKKYDLALDFYYKALVIKKKYAPNHKNTSNCYESIGDVYINKKNYKKAVKNLELALSLKKKIYLTDTNSDIIAIKKKINKAKECILNFI